MTKEEFLNRAVEKHGNKYIYHDLKDKVLSNDYVSIEFEGELYSQKVVKHLTLGRCPEKNTPRKTNEEFITEAISVWGDKYDYSLVKYNGALNKIIIIYDGIEYEQVAISHLRGLCCEKRYDTETYVQLIKRIHGDKYDYSLIEYTSMHDKVKVIYKDKVYEINAFNFINGALPERVSWSRLNTKEEFIEKAVNVHGDRYVYSQVEYTKSREKVNIICKKHGVFSQTPNAHIEGAGCSKCYRDFINDNKVTYELDRYYCKDTKQYIYK